MQPVLTASPSLPRIASRNGSASSSSSSFSTSDDDLKYTSLKDVLLGLSPTPLATAIDNEDDVFLVDFNSSDIPIRNHLVKRAASAYLQSSAILIARDRSFRSRLWRRLRRRAAALRSAWSCYARSPVHVCAGLVASSFRFVLSCLAFRRHD